MRKHMLIFICWHEHVDNLVCTSTLLNSVSGWMSGACDLGVDYDEKDGGVYNTQAYSSPFVSVVGFMSRLMHLMHGQWNGISLF